MSTEPGRALPPDYDTDPGRFAANQAATARYGLVGDVHAVVAARLRDAAPGPVLDLGGGNGTLARLLAGRAGPVVVLDSSDLVLAAPRPSVRADARRLPFAAGRFAAVAALWMLYHLPDPLVGLREAARVLRPGGQFVACTSSRHNDPELAEHLPRWGRPFAFDAESAPALVARAFRVTEVLRWDRPLVELPDAEALALFLRGRSLSAADAERAAGRHRTPLRVTKRGVLIWATTEM